MRKDKLVIFSTRRSGSTVALQMLFQHEKELHNCQSNLDEFFNIKLFSKKHRNIYNENGQHITTTFSDKKTDDAFQPSAIFDGENIRVVEDYNSDINYRYEGLGDTEVERRFKMIQNTNNYYLVKLFAEQLRHPGLFNYFNDNYTFVCTTREDTFEQVLSYGILANYGSGFVKNNHKPKMEPSSMYLRRPTFNLIEQDLLDYHEMFPKVKNKILVKFEDIRSLDDKNKFFDLLDFDPPETFKLNEKSFTTPMFTGDKATLFSNMDEITEWYNNSLISKLEPIKDV